MEKINTRLILGSFMPARRVPARVRIAGFDRSGLYRARCKVRVPARLIAVLLLLLGSSACLAQSPPNIILILTDDQGWTDTSVMQDPSIPESASDFYQTPSLESLAAAGMRFSNAYSAAPICAPSRAAIQSGKSPAQLQITANITSGDVKNSKFLSHQSTPLTPPMPRTALPSSEVTIAERIKQSNPDYLTAHYGKWHLNLGPWDHESQGYEFGGRLPVDLITDPKATTAITNASNNFMQLSADSSRPFFLQVSFEADHDPTLATQQTIDKYNALPPGERHTNPIYAAMNEELDTGIGQIMQKVRDLGIEDNTYIFYTSDNGGLRSLNATTNDPLYAGKHSIWEGGIRVPFMVKGPNIAAGTVSDIPVVAMDLYNTITELAGVTDPLPSGNEGASLVPILENGGVLPAGMDSLQRGYGLNGELYFHSTHNSNFNPASAIRDGDFKLVRLYGIPGQADQVFLFDLSQNPTESPDPNSSLNLADAMPQKTAELVTKLDAWLLNVDASFSYDVAENVSIRWSADQPGPTAGGWRSVTNHDYLFRELWESEGPASPASVSTTSSLGGLPGQAFHFDGGDVMERKFFHVSSIGESDRDLDHSATIEMWLKLDDLSQERVLFESGDDLRGLSLTLGNADTDGLFDDLRFRVLDEDGSHLTVTAPFGGAIDPTAEFFQLVAVMNDSPTDRYVALYLNGDEIARVNGVNGSDPLDWDGFDPAGLGGIGGRGLGANGGLGDLPFAGSGLLGQIALVQFNNFAITSDDVRDRFDAVAFLPGDIDGDGFVGITDLNLVLGNWNQSVPPGDPLADPSGDGFVGIADLNEVLGNWNAGTPPTSSVPEPAAVGLLLLGSLALLCRRGQ